MFDTSILSAYLTTPDATPAKTIRGFLPISQENGYLAVLTNNFMEMPAICG